MSQNMSPDNQEATFERTSAQIMNSKYILLLYVTGATPNSSRAIRNIKAICEQHLQGRYELEVVDIYQQPELSHQEGILFAPTLIKRFPLPLRKLVGDMSDETRVLTGLGLLA